MLPLLTRSIFSPLLLPSSYMKVRRYLKSFEDNQWGSQQAILEAQWQRVRSIISHAYQNVPFYRKRFDENGIDPEDIKSPEDMRKIPILTKDDLNSHSDELFALNIDKKELYRNTSGGSTGMPISFYQTNDYWYSLTAATIRCRSWTGYEEGEKQTQIWGSPIDISKSQRFFEKIKSKILNFQLIPGFDITRRNLEGKVEKIIKFKPKLITGYASLLYLFAQYLVDNDILEIRPLAVVSSADTLLDQQRRVIEKAFGCEVYDRYGGRELGCIAQECEYHDGLHVSAENVYVEFVEIENIMKEDKLYKMIITSLTNYGMPFIRYDIEDLGIPSEGQCKCGRGLPRIAKVQGRINDIIVSSTGRLIPGEFFTYFLMHFDFIYQFQVVQEKRDHITVNIVPKNRNGRIDLAEIEEGIKRCVGDDMQVDVHIVQRIDLSRSGKFRFTRSEIPLEL